MSNLPEIEKRLRSCAEYLHSGNPDQRASVLETADELLDQRNALIGVPRLKSTAMLYCNGCKHSHAARHVPSLVIQGVQSYSVEYLICPCCDRVRS